MFDDPDEADMDFRETMHHPDVRTYVDGGGDLLSATLAECLVEIETEAHDHGWDLLPMLYLLLRTLPPTDVADHMQTEHSVAMLAYLVVPVKIPSEFGRLGGDGIEVYLAALQTWIEMMIREGLGTDNAWVNTIVKEPVPDFFEPIAWALLNEAWGCTMPPGLEDDQLDAYRALYDYKVKDMPGATEVRSVSGIDRMGTQYAIDRERISDEVHVRIIAKGDENTQYTGRVIEGLTALMAVTP